MIKDTLKVKKAQKHEQRNKQKEILTRNIIPDTWDLMSDIMAKDIDIIFQY